MLAIKGKIYIFAALSALALGACTAKKSGKSGSPTPTIAPTIAPTAASTAANVSFLLNGSSASSVYVSLNQAYTWAITATSSDGSAISVSRVVVATNQPAGMTISGSQVTFTPRQTTDLNGSLTAYATRSDGSETSQVFYWVQDPNSTTSTGCTQALLTQAINAFTTKQFDLNSIPTIFAACAQNITNLFRNI